MDAVTTHNSTDFDALASLVACGLLHPQAKLVLPTRVNPNVKAFLSIHKDLFAFASAKEVTGATVENLFVVDTNQWKRIDKLSSLKGKVGRVHVWDHHGAETDMAPAFECEASVGACTTLLVEQLKEKGAVITPMQATLFLAGIYEDTGNLTFPSTTSRDAYAVAYLLEHNGELDVLENFLRPAYGPKQKDLLNEMIGKAQRIKVNGHAIAICQLELAGHAFGLSLVVHMARDILNVDAAFAIFTEPEQKRSIVIGRSGVDSIDVGAMMRVMGGGGHPSAGSAMLKDVDNPAGVQEWVLELLKDNRRSVVQIGDLMSFPVESFAPETTMEEAAQKLKDRGFSGMPVVDDGVLVGILSIRDVEKAKSGSQKKQPVKAFMARNIFTAPPDMSVPRAARLMVKYDIGRIPVVENGKLIGIFTRSDAMLYYYDLLPE
ncbi:MAG: CBS domain-containing protein [Desulfatibacillaceae bacterium]|nr:CBS domain-containing protein [Desulfatibacillaceae bacterium]